MKCARCQFELETDSRYCKQCGATIQPYSRRIDLAAERAAVLEPPISAPAPFSESKPDNGGSVEGDAEERLIWRGRPAWRAFYSTWLAWALLCMIAAYYVFGRTASGGLLRNNFWLAVAASGIGLLSRELLIVFGVRYRLTNQRLFVDRGWLTLVTDQAELIHVDDVRIRRRLDHRLYGVGDVDVFASDSSNKCVTFESIQNPEVVAESLRRCVQSIRNRKAVYVEAV